MPRNRLAVEVKPDFKIVGPELAVRVRRRMIVQLESLGLDGEAFLSSFVSRELRHRQAPVQKDQRSVVLELAVGGPLHPDQLRSQNGEPRVATDDDGLWI